MIHRIFIVEDHEVMRKVIHDYISNEADLEVCGYAATGRETLDAVPDLEAELLLIDVSLPEMNGLELLKEVRMQRPDLPCLMYSGHIERQYARQALSAGAQGYVLKGDPEDLLVAIRCVLDGEVYLSESLRSGEPTGQ